MRSTNRRPDLQLPQAYELALGALGSETNSFYCLRADARSMTESPGSAEWRPGAVEWHFEFYATNGQFNLQKNQNDLGQIDPSVVSSVDGKNIVLLAKLF